MSVYQMETEEDMAGYFDSTAGHGVTAVFTNSASEQSTINIIINNEYFEFELGTGVEGTKPVAYCRTVDTPNAVFGNTLAVSAIKDTDGNTLVSAKNYTIVNVQADRTGISAFMLEEI